MKLSVTLSFPALFVALALAVPACKDTARLSVERASEHVAFVAEAVEKDVEEVRRGLPAGAEVVAARWKADPQVGTDLQAASDALELARRKVQDLRMAKSTFFAIADTKGVVIRNDQEQDRMAGKGLFGPYPALAEATTRYVETRGSMPEASGVRAPREDAQWVAGTPVRVDGVVKGIYASGWSFSSYAYRLEFALRGRIRSDLSGKAGEKEPLVYVFVVVDKAVYGTPVSPEVSRNAVSALDPLAQVKDAGTFSSKVDITGRTYGLAVRRTPALGTNVGVAVLRSET